MSDIVTRLCWKCGAIFEQNRLDPPKSLCEKCR